MNAWLIHVMLMLYVKILPEALYVHVQWVIPEMVSIVLVSLNSPPWHGNMPGSARIG